MKISLSIVNLKCCNNVRNFHKHQTWVFSTYILQSNIRDRIDSTKLVLKLLRQIFVAFLTTQTSN